MQTKGWQTMPVGQTASTVFLEINEIEWEQSHLFTYILAVAALKDREEQLPWGSSGPRRLIKHFLSGFNFSSWNIFLCLICYLLLIRVVFLLSFFFLFFLFILNNAHMYLLHCFMCHIATKRCSIHQS